jgi:hypothetical protein
MYEHPLTPNKLERGGRKTRMKNIRELSHPLLNLAERDGRASYPQFTARRRVPT